MIVSFVLRLVADRLVEGVTVGHVEAVDTGERAVVRDVDELVGFLRGVATAAAPSDPAALDRVRPAGPDGATGT